MRSLIALLLSLWLAPAWAQVPMTGAGRGSPIAVFTPASLSPAWWLEARDYPNFFKSNTGSGAAPSADTDPIGWARDLSGNGITLTSAADSSVRPSLAGVGGKPSLVCDSANSQIITNSTGLGSYTAGASSWFFALKSNSPNINTIVSAEGNNASTTPFYSIVQSGSPATTLNAFIRTSTTTLFSADVRVSTFDGSNHVVGVIDDGSGLTPYFDGSGGTRVAYSAGRTGTLVGNTFALCGILRTSTGSFWKGSIYGGVVVNRVLTGTEITDLNTYLMGLY